MSFSWAVSFIISNQVLYSKNVKKMFGMHFIFYDFGYCTRRLFWWCFSQLAFVSAFFFKCKTVHLHIHDVCIILLKETLDQATKKQNQKKKWTPDYCVTLQIVSGICNRTVDFQRHFLFLVVCWHGIESQAFFLETLHTRKPAKSTWPPQVGQNYYPAAWPKPCGHLECAD